MKTLHRTLVLLGACAALNAWGQSLQVPVPETPPWCPEDGACNSLVECLFQGQIVSGRASLRMGEDGAFDKPVLLIEGFDFEAGWDSETHGFGGVTWSGIFGGQPLEFPAVCNTAHSSTSSTPWAET